jgi:hypothetical protein
MISRQEGLLSAKEAVLRAGLIWDEPVNVNWGLIYYSIWTNSKNHGGNVSVRVNRRSGVATVRGRTIK